MIVVHHLENSRSQRLLWLLEELGLPYEVNRYRRDPRTSLAPPELRAIHPLGKSPVITDGDLVIAETAAIIDHLLQTYGDGRFSAPTGTAESRAITYWTHYAEGSAMPPFLLKLVFARVAAQSPVLIRPIARLIAKGAETSFIGPQIRTHMDWWEQALGKTEWFAGPDITAADFMMSFPAEIAVSRVGVQSHPHLRAFVDRVHSRPAYRRALKIGGPYAYAE